MAVIDVVDVFTGQPNQDIAGRITSTGGRPWEAILANKGNPGLVGGYLINREPLFMYAALRSEARVEAVEFTVIAPSANTGTGTGAGAHLWSHRDVSGKIPAHLGFDYASRSFMNADIGVFQPLTPFAVNPKGTYGRLPPGVPLNFTIDYTVTNQITVTLPSQIGGGTIVSSDPQISTIGWSGEAGHTPQTTYCVFEIPNSGWKFQRCAVYGLTTPTVGGNLAPTVNAGADVTARVGAAVVRTAVGADPEGSPLTYAWTGPAGVTLSGAATATVTATSTAPGNYTITCTVSDGTRTDVDSFVLTATEGGFVGWGART